MEENIIMLVVCFGCGILFFGIGAYAKNRKEPMWFWSGTEVKASVISDVKRYNKENAIMWKLYSLWYFAAALAGMISTEASAVILVLSCTVGLGLLIYTYSRIYKKYTTE